MSFTVKVSVASRGVDEDSTYLLASNGAGPATGRPTILVRGITRLR
jgi:hypothetical protein